MKALWWICHHAYKSYMFAWPTIMEHRTYSKSQKNTCDHLPYKRVNIVVQREPTWISEEDEVVGRDGEREGLSVDSE